MINHILSFSIQNKLLIGLFTLAIVFGGIWSMTRIPLDAVPDITNNQVQVITQAPSLGTSDIEQFVTYPVELSMANLPGVIEIRSISRFGLSVVTVVFEDDMGTYRPRQLVSEKLTQVKEEIPEGFGKPFMGPISTGLGEIYQYTLQVDSAYEGEYSAVDLRSIQDWIVRRQMAMVPGVVEINAFGGKIKQYEVAVDPEEIHAMGLTITEIFQALEQNNQNTGGAYIEKNHFANFIRAEGLARNLEDIEQIVIRHQNGMPITIGDVAQVQFGEAVRYGAFTKDGKGEAVGGMILMLKGANSNDVIGAVKKRIKSVQKTLPEGVHLEPFMDRSELIRRTTSTISENLILGALIVIFVLVFLLGNWRGGLIVASTIPLSLLFAFILMYVFDVWANLMSLGAIDFGIIVDGAVIIVEGTVFMLNEKVLKGKQISSAVRDDTAHSASSKMMNAAFFGQLIILIVFIPILALEGVEGKMFHPMALTFMFAMIGVMILCLTYVPMMSAWFLRVKPNAKKSWGDHLVNRLEATYEGFLKAVLQRRKLVAGISVLLFALSIFTFSRMGGEFIPQLDEGDLAFHIILKPGSSLSESISSASRIEGILLEEFPEVEHAMTRFGVAEVPTDPMPMDVGDCIVKLKPRSEWVSAVSKEELIEKMKEAISVVPGVSYEFTQPIEMRFNELLTGVREDVAVKIFGEDLEVLAQKAEEVGALIAPIEGVADFKVEATTGLPQMTVRYNRKKLAQYGLNISEINHTIQTAFGGGKAGVVFEGERRFDLVVRLLESSRQGIGNLEQLYISLPGGGQIPLQEVADVKYENGPMQISRDNTQRRTYVGINVRGRDVESVVTDIQEEVERNVDLPPGYSIHYGGAFENLERASSRLKLLVPIALGLIFLLIFFALQSFKQTIMIYVAIPLAAIGGVFSLWIRDMPFSISAGIGFIVLFGVAVLNGLVLVSSWNELKAEGIQNLDKRIRLGARRRLRPILLTALTDVLGFLPMAISVSAGAEVQRPLATVVIGGMITATLLTLFILPLLYRWMENENSNRTGNGSVAMATVALIVALGLSGYSSIQAQSNPQPISLEAAIDRAHATYPSLKSAQLSVENQRALKKTAWDLGSTQLYSAGEELQENVGVYTVIGIQQQNIDLFGIGPKKRLQSERIEQAQAALDLSEAQLTLKVKRSYAQLLTAKNRMQLYESLDSVFREFQTAVELRFETQETSELEFLAAENEARQAKMRAVQAVQDYQIALEQFNLWLVTDTVFTVEEDYASEVQDVQKLPVSAIAAHPIIQVAEKQMAVTNRQVQATRANFLPKLNAQYGWQTIDGQSGFHQFQLGLSVPLFFRKQQGQFQSARIQQEMAAQELDQTSREMRTQYLSTLESYEKWKSTWTYYREGALRMAQRQREAARLSYREGAIDYLEFLQHVKAAMRIEIQAWDALEAYLNSRFQLEYFVQS
jgi:cobalt-zinc-cadmium resistance protein CzcA